MNLKPLLFFIYLCLAIPGTAQIRVPLPNTSDEGLIFWDRFPLVQIDQDFLSRFTFPENFAAEDTAYAILRFKGSEFAPENDTLFILLGNFKRKTPILLIDENQNKDFRDDKVRSIAQGDTSLLIELHPFSNPSNTHSLNFWYESEIDEKFYQFAYSKLSPPYLQAGKKLYPAKYWPMAGRLATCSGRLVVSGDTFKIGVYDGNFSGTFGDAPEDKLSIVGVTRDLKFTKTIGAVPLKKGEQITVKETVYAIRDFANDGAYVVLDTLPEKRKLTLADSLIGNFNMRKLDGDSAYLHAVLSDSLYTILYGWGSWCGGCRAQLPYLQSLVEGNREKVQVVGLVNDYVKNAQAYCNKKGLKWEQLLLNDEVEEALMLEHWPTYILLDSQKRIVGMDMSLKELQAFFQVEE
ncbi:MAG: redoxin domain-containing protein [Bacteroidota bacterium]